MPPRRAWLALAAGLALAPHPALANGAFPDSQALLLPADRPLAIGLATNFGLLLSEDGGATWQWTCERPATSMGALYAVGAPPDDRLYGLSPDVGLAVSTDGSCSWRRSGGPLTDLVASDYFPDPTDSAHVLAVAGPKGDAGAGAAPPALYASHDGGETFDALPLYTAPDGATLGGVEVARSDPQIVTLAVELAGGLPLIVRSLDGGATWTTIDVSGALGPHPFRIVAVDPADPSVIYLRVLADGGDVLAVSRDGGASIDTPLTVAGGSLSAFARLPSGTLLVAGLIPSIDDGGAPTTTGAAWRSNDGGRTFQDWTLAPKPHLVALAERNGTLYLAGKNYADGWAVATSTDEGTTIVPLARYDQVSAIKACAMAACQASCDDQAGVKIWPPEICTASPADAGPTADAGPDADAGPTADAGPDAGPTADGGAGPAGSSGCGCTHAAGGRPGLAALAGTLLAWTFTRRRPPPPRRRGSRG